MFTPDVNATCINKPFTCLRIGLMADLPESLQRLLDYARSATAHLQTAKQIKEVADLARRLEATPQAMYNWKTRGLSEPVAVQAEAEFGCSACWLLTGIAPPGWTPTPGSAVFTSELLAELAARGESDIRKAENAARIAVDMDPLPKARPSAGTRKLQRTA